MIKKIGDFLAWLGGADKDVIGQVPWERARFTQMAGVLLTTAGLAVASMAFALHDGMKAHWVWAGLLGIMWGFVILNLDRLLVLSIGSTRDLRRIVTMAIPRFLMAMLLAIVISTPLVLRIFASDIDAQIYNTQLQRSAQQKNLSANSAEQDQINKIQQKIQADKDVLAGKLPDEFTSPRLQAAQAKVAALQSQQDAAANKRDDALEAWKCERYGQGEKCHRASTKVGQGPLATAKQQIYQEADRKAAALTAQLKAAQRDEAAAEKAIEGNKSAALKTAQAAAAKELPELQKRHKTLTDELQNRADRGTEVNTNDNKLPAQIGALFDIGHQKKSLLFAHLAVFLLFFMIEILPVTVKILLNFGEVTAYEAKLKLRENTEIDKAQNQRIAARRAEERKARVRSNIEDGKDRIRVNVEEDMRTREEQLGKRANEHVANEMMTIIDLALAEWSNQLRVRLAGAGQTGHAAPQLSNGNGQHPGGDGDDGESENQPLGGRSHLTIDLPDEENL